MIPTMSMFIELQQASQDAPVVKLVNLILTDAIKKGASDIHIECYEKTFRVRYRIDGVLYEVMNSSHEASGGDYFP